MSRVMGWVDPDDLHEPEDGATVPAAWGSAIAAGQAMLGRRPSALVRVGQPIQARSGEWVTLPVHEVDDPRRDTAGLVGNSPGFRASEAGWWRVSVWASLSEFQQTGGNRRLRFVVANDAEVEVDSQEFSFRAAGDAASTSWSASAILWCEAGDTVRAQVFHDGGNNEAQVYYMTSMRLVSVGKVHGLTPPTLVDLDDVHVPADSTVPPATWGAQASESLRFLASPPFTLAVTRAEDAASGVPRLPLLGGRARGPRDPWLMQLSGNGANVVVPVDGAYCIVGSVSVDGTPLESGSSHVRARLLVNGTATRAWHAISTPWPSVASVPFEWRFEAEEGDTVAVDVTHDAGSSLAVSARWALVWEARPSS